MASQCLVTTGFEDECREIHDACNQPSRLSLLLARRSSSDRQQIKATYHAMFGEDLAGELHKTLMTNQEDELCKLLYLWMLDPAERDAIMARDAVESRGATDYRVLVEIFTRRKQNQLFFTKQAYLARFKRNLEQDMVTEPSHPYQKALKKNGFSEFEQSLRIVVKCIYSPSMYFSKLLHRSLQCSANNKRLVTRAILGSDDVDMDKIKSVFKSSCGKELKDFIQESLPESDYRDFLVSVAKGSMAS
uniref:Annexin n=1 Tax=Leersia perrieri TaxID=77586 RepID=A0A0D9XEE5_9ORYZ